jgi:hypothetical protein
MKGLLLFAAIVVVVEVANGVAAVVLLPNGKAFNEVVLDVAKGVFVVANGCCWFGATPVEEAPKTGA